MTDFKFGTWYPINTAPLDGSWILAIHKGYIPAVVQWWNNNWVEVDDACDEALGKWELTHWMPLPPQPE